MRRRGFSPRSRTTPSALRSQRISGIDEGATAQAGDVEGAAVDAAGQRAALDDPADNVEAALQRAALQADRGHEELADARHDHPCGRAWNALVDGHVAPAEQVGALLRA